MFDHDSKNEECIAGMTVLLVSYLILMVTIHVGHRHHEKP